MMMWREECENGGNTIFTPQPSIQHGSLINSRSTNNQSNARQALGVTNTKMGVKNLWRLLLPIGHRVSIETLSHQTLAIDASIWLTQISKACRDPDTGRALPNKPHVRIFLLRLMKLLYHQIKPVVVFDGKREKVLPVLFCFIPISPVNRHITKIHQ